MTDFLANGHTGRGGLSNTRQKELEQAGPVRSTFAARGCTGAGEAYSIADFEARYHVFAGLSVVRVEFTLRNTNSAKHPGGLWDLGDPGSVLLTDAAYMFRLPAPVTTHATCSVERGAPAADFPLPFELYQESSGGENWRGRNHVNRAGEVPLRFRGYRLNGAETPGRATPIVLIPGLGVTVPHFWENFPIAVEATADSITLRLLPKQFPDLHELQGGEQKTWMFAVAVGGDAEAEALEWFRTPPRVTLPPEWVAATGAVPYLTPQSTDPNRDYLALVGVNLSSQLRPTVQDNANYGLTLSTPTKLSEFAKTLIITAKAFKLGLTSCVLMPAFNDDAHEAFADQKVLDMTVQTIATVMNAFLADLAVPDPTCGGATIADNLVVTIHGDTPKTPLNKTAWPDATPDNANWIYALGGGWLKSGWWGGVNADGTVSGFDAARGTIVAKQSSTVTSAAVAGAVAYAVAKGDMRRVFDFSRADFTGIVRPKIM